MITAFLHEAFHRLTRAPANAPDEEGRWGACGATLSQAVEHVIDETYPRLRIVPSYGQRLSGPVSSAFRYIDTLVEQIPEALSCNRAAFVNDIRVNAFFSGPGQIQEVFSQSTEVRDLFRAKPDAPECWALLCMRKTERRQFGMQLNGDEVRKEVMQTGVSFSDHQVVSPGCTEEEARSALKCCVFNSLLAYIRRRSKTAKEQSSEWENRRRVLRGRLRFARNQTEALRLEEEIREVEQQLAGQSLHLHTPDDHIDFMTDVLSNPQQYVARENISMRLNRMGIKLDDDNTTPNCQVTLCEIRVACHEPRVATLVRFPREELLPHQDYLRKADLFLAV